VYDAPLLVWNTGLRRSHHWRVLFLCNLLCHILVWDRIMRLRLPSFSSRLVESVERDGLLKCVKTWTELEFVLQVLWWVVSLFVCLLCLCVSVSVCLLLWLIAMYHTASMLTCMLVCLPACPVVCLFLCVSLSSALYCSVCLHPRVSLHCLLSSHHMVTSEYANSVVGVPWWSLPISSNFTFFSPTFLVFPSIGSVVYPGCHFRLPASFYCRVDRVLCLPSWSVAHNQTIVVWTGTL